MFYVEKTDLPVPKYRAGGSNIFLSLMERSIDMANQEQLDLLLKSAQDNDRCKKWNRWREENWGIEIDLEGANLSSLNLRGVNLGKANLREANLENAYLFSADLRKSILVHANLKDANLVYSNFTGADLSNCNLGRADLSGAKLSQSNLSKTNLGGSELVYCNLEEANLSYSNLKGANLAEANLYCSNLAGANLQRANLQKSHISQANFMKANLIGAEVEGLDFSQAIVDENPLFSVNAREKEEETKEEEVKEEVPLLPETAEMPRPKALPPTSELPLSNLSDISNVSDVSEAKASSKHLHHQLDVWPGKKVHGSGGVMYEIVGPLTKGGMSFLFKAFRTKDKLPVVIKYLPPIELSNNNSIFRFIREGKTIVNLNHENIVKGIDFHHDLEECFCVMEYIEGPSLLEMIEDHGALPVELATRIIWQISKVLICLQDAQIYHRDIKPGNIIWCQNRTAKLVDFGIAKSDDTRLTKRDFVIGTPDYISPEQLEGKELDIATDIYSLGASYYEMVTGVKPFRSNSMKEISQRLKKLPVRANILTPSLPEAVVNILEAMLQPKPKRRIHDAYELHLELTSLLKSLDPDYFSSFK